MRAMTIFQRDCPKGNDGDVDDDDDDDASTPVLGQYITPY